ncbi:MAG TPA: PIN domain nuclease [Chthoniobacterales bacterium]|jgi:predicted nucleic acid-binding protein|nr:PIN domain nuclease [Chthoniobacterales bacterium]
MVLVDTGIWIDFLAGNDTSEVGLLVALLEQEESISFIALILQELMQGCSDDKDARKIEGSFLPFVEIYPQRSSYRLAAKIFRDCRKKGYTIRSSIDCLVAACAMECDCSVLHKNRDYRYIGEVCGLKVVKR